jgi:hypothetical protein
MAEEILDSSKLPASEILTSCTPTVHPERYVGIAYAMETTTDPEISLKEVVRGGQTVCDLSECNNRGGPGTLLAGFECSHL